MKSRFQPIPNWDVWSLTRKMDFCLLQKVVPENYVFKVTPRRNDILCTHVMFKSLPRRPSFHSEAVPRLAPRGCPTSAARWSRVGHSEWDRGSAKTARVP